MLRFAEQIFTLKYVCTLSFVLQAGNNIHKKEY